MSGSLFGGESEKCLRLGALGCLKNQFSSQPYANHCGRRFRMAQNGSHLKSKTRSASHVAETATIAAEPTRNTTR